MRKVLVLGGVVLLVVCFGASAVRADGSLLGSTYYELSPVFHQGGLSFPDGNEPIKASGVHIYERNGVGGKLVVTALVAMLLALGRSNTEYMGSTYGANYRVDYYRVKSSEEMASEDAARQRSVDATAKHEYQMDVQLYFPQEGETTARGFSWEITPWSWGNDIVFEIGFLWASLRDTVCTDPMMPAAPAVKCRYSNFGSPLRILYPIGSYALFSLQWDLNWLALSEDGHTLSHASPVRASLTLSPIERLFVRGGLVTSRTDTEDLGVTLEAGLRF